MRNVLLTQEFIIELRTKYRGWEYNVEPSTGALYWAHPNGRVFIYAEPNYNGEDHRCKFDLGNDVGDYTTVRSIRLIKGDTLKQKRALYFKTLNEVMKTKKNLIKKYMEKSLNWNKN
jgi:hypothetical protein